MRTYYIVGCLLCLLCIIFCLSSCVAPQHGTLDPTSGEHHITTTSEEHMTKIPLEPDKNNLPSYADLSSIKPGMTKDEVFTLVGNPQREEIRKMPVNEESSLAVDRLCYIYDSNDGKSICVVWGVADPNSHLEVVLMVEDDVQE